MAEEKPVNDETMFAAIDTLMKVVMSQIEPPNVRVSVEEMFAKAMSTIRELKNIIDAQNALLALLASEIDWLKSVECENRGTFTRTARPDDGSH